MLLSLSKINKHIKKIFLSLFLLQSTSPGPYSVIKSPHDLTAPLLLSPRSLRSSPHPGTHTHPRAFALAVCFTRRTDAHMANSLPSVLLKGHLLYGLWNYAVFFLFIITF